MDKKYYMDDLKYERGIIYNFIKRTIDILGSLIGLIILSPIFVIMCTFIRIDSHGPIFFSHKRIGKGGKIINVYKFRTMVPNAEDLIEKLPEKQKKEFLENFKLEDDPRITSIGKFLRKSSLDELPQLFNILIGNMSIVGPRPIVEKELVKYGENAIKLLSVKPGLTGMWQANGRSDTTYEERVKLDMTYIDRRNTYLDIKLIFKTISVVIHRRGAK
ncbi:sugar transferase [Hathewaya histolytica]|uniref:sugar transferase n=1 Tax=Hathewaya histolytica TaxID=1498 RepID=UPI003B671A6F